MTDNSLMDRIEQGETTITDAEEVRLLYKALRVQMLTIVGLMFLLAIVITLAGVRGAW